MEQGRGLTCRASFLTLQAMIKLEIERANPPLPVSGHVPGTYVRLLFDYLAAQGQDVGHVLGEAAAPPGPDGTVAAAHWRRLLTQAALHLGDPALGLRLGATITPAHLGPLGYVLQLSGSSATALERYLRYQRLVHDVSPVRHFPAEGAVVLEWGDDARAIGLLANQCGLAALVHFARCITGQPLRPLVVHFVEAAPADMRPYAELFGCPVLFGQTAARIHLPADVLAMPLRQPDPALAAMLEQQVAALFAAMPAREALLQSVRGFISQHLIQGEPALQACAEALNLSDRTLRRRLQALGWSYRALLEDSRRCLAENYLRDRRLALPEVALLLGYSEQSAFNRAFRRWTGMSPRRWRLAHA